MKKNLAILFSIIILSSVTGIGLRFVFAFTEPLQTPPAGNVATPLNVGSTGQTKSGSLGVGLSGAPSGTYKLEVDGGSGTTGGYFTTGGSGATYGVYGRSSSSNSTSAAVYGERTGSGYAGFFLGPVTVSGTLTVTGTLSAGSIAAAGGWTDDGTVVRLTESTDNVGIGTTAPGRTSFDANSKILTIESGVSNRPGVLELIGLSGSNAGEGNPTGLVRFGNSISGTGDELAEIRVWNNDATNQNDGYLAFRTADAGALTTRMTITNTGNVGIGTASPGAKLEVAGGIKVTSSAEANLGTGLQLVNNDTILWYGSGATGNLLIKSTATGGPGDRVTISTGGNVGIGTTGPTTAKLVISGGNPAIDAGTGRIINVGTPSAAADAATKSYVDSTVTGGTQSGSFSTLTVSGNTFLATTSGNVGIGTTSPGGKLHVTGLTVNQQIRFGNTDESRFMLLVPEVGGGGYNPLSQAGDSGIIYQDLAGLVIGPNTGTSKGLRIAPTGNVGIGTTSPSAKLEVAGTLRVTPGLIEGYSGQMSLRSYGNLDLIMNYDGAVGQGEHIRFFGPAGTSELMRIQDNGNVGIGTTSPGAIFQTSLVSTATINEIGGIFERTGGPTSGAARGIGIAFKDASNPSLVAGISGIRDNAAGNYNGSLAFFTNNGGVPATTFANMGERMRIDTTGNVGIGTTSPAFKLDVAGTGSFTQPVIVGTPTIATHAATKSYVDSSTVGQTGWTDDGTVVRLTTSTDNVGIGTTSPNRIFNVYHASVPRISIDSPASAEPGYELYSAGTLSSMVYRPANTNDMRLYVGGGDRISITPTGNVGIGKSSGLSGKLHVLGGNSGGPAEGNQVARFEDSVGSGMNVDIGGVNNSYGWIRAFTSGIGERNLAIQPLGGNVGIGTTSPGYKLDVGNQGATSNIDNSIRISSRGDASGSGDNPLSEFVMSNSADYGSSNFKIQARVQGNTNGIGARFYVNSSAAAGVPLMAMALNNDGNVGIGTTSPAFKLDVAGTGSFTQPVIVGTPTAASHAATKSYVDSSVTGGVSGAANYIAKFTAANSVGNSVIYESAGNVGIGTTGPNAKLDVQGIFAVSNNAGNYWGFDRDDSDGRLKITESGTERVSVLQAGNVGIGDTAPTNKLAVSGDIAASGSLKITGNGNSYIQTGNVGIGTAAPGAKFDVRGAIYGGDSQFYNSVSLTNGFAGSVQSWIWTGAANQLSLGVGSIGEANIKMVINSAGNVGIGTTSPGAKLQVGAGTGNVIDTQSVFIAGAKTKFASEASLPQNQLFIYDSSALAAGIGGAISFGADAGGGQQTWFGAIEARKDNATSGDYGGALAFYTRPTGATAGERMRISSAGNVGIGTPSPSVKLDVVGSVKVTSGNLDMGGGNVSGVNKLTVTTIDPEYVLNGKKYATYVASLVGGVKEEVTGKATLHASRFTLHAFEYTIDFDKIDEGSDLWVWRQVIDFSKNNVEVLATPYGELALIAYQIEGNKIIFKSDKAVEFSYRLTGRRHDWKEWPTKLK